MKHKMIAAFKKAEGGLFSAVEKADVGNSYQEMEKQGIALMGWADPFMPDFSLPEHVKKAMLAEIEAENKRYYIPYSGVLKENVYFHFGFGVWMF